MLRFTRGSLLDAADDGQGGGGSTAAFDPAAFRTSLLGDVTKLFTNFATTLKTDIAKLTPAASTATGNETQDSTTDATATSGAKPADPAVAAQLRALERRNKELDDQFKAMKTESDATKAAAERKEQEALVRTKLSKFKFADDAAAEDAFEIFGSKIKRTEDGAFVGHDGTPIDQYLDEGLRAKPYLLAPKEVSGAGARAGKQAGGTAAVSLESIKPGMSAADVAAAAAQISAVLQGQR